MNSLKDYQQALKAAHEPHAALPLDNGGAALITQRGGRVLGIFPTEDAPNLLWTNHAAFASGAALKAFAAAGEWNLGGERLWIAPEIQYNVRDRADFWGTLHVPAAMDPAAYALEADAGQVTLRAEMALPAHNLATGTQQISVERVYQPVPNPLAAATSRRVIYGGYQQRVTLRVTEPHIAAEAWSLMQLPAGGQLVIPCMPQVEAADYFGDVPGAARAVRGGDTPHLRLALTGRQQFKVGYRAWCMTGRMGYWRTLPDGRAALLVRAFFSNPSNPYAEEPPNETGVNGFSVHVYNDGGEFGGDQSFGEMECSGTTLIHGRTAATDTFLLWGYVGPPDEVRALGRLLLGVAL
jgi:hypothetical protein